MGKKVLVFICFSILCCMGVVKGKGPAGLDAQFDHYKENFVTALWEVYPSWASSVGYHKYDSVLVVPDNASRNTELVFCKANLDSLKQYNLAQLSDANKIDYYLIENQLKYAIWGITEERGYTWNPAVYNVSEGFANMLGNDYDDINTRLRNFYARMKSIPTYYHVAQSNIKHPTKEHVALAIEQIRVACLFLRMILKKR